MQLLAVEMLATHVLWWQLQLAQALRSGRLSFPPAACYYQPMHKPCSFVDVMLQHMCKHHRAGILTRLYVGIAAYIDKYLYAGGWL